MLVPPMKVRVVLGAVATAILAGCASPTPAPLPPSGSAAPTTAPRLNPPEPPGPDPEGMAWVPGGTF